MGNLLCVSNFAPNTGYAWDFIEGLYGAIADDLAGIGIRTWVAYPKVDSPPRILEGTAARPLELPFDLSSPQGFLRVLRAINNLDIGTIYLTDRSTWHPLYAVLRLAGVRSIVVHDHTSGRRSRPTGLKRLVKGWSRRFRPALADFVLAVSGFVARRKIEVDLVPRDRVQVHFNSVLIPDKPDRKSLRHRWQIPEERPVVACACRAAEYKGVQHLLRAFDLASDSSDQDPFLIYFGDGPYMGRLREIHRGLNSRNRIILAGYVPDTDRWIGGADVAVVPSTWDEAFGLAALEPAAQGVPVVASRVGGIPEVVQEGVTGILVPPGNEAALADAITRLLEDPQLRHNMGENGRQMASERFSRHRQLVELTRLFREVTTTR